MDKDKSFGTFLGEVLKDLKAVKMDWNDAGVVILGYHRCCIDREVAEAAKGREKCPKCKGSGKWELPRLKPNYPKCPICNGTGEAAKVEGGGVDCPDCHGYGYLKYRCETCNRTGKEAPVAAEDWRIVLWRFAHEIKERRDYDLAEFQDWLTEELETLLSRQSRKMTADAIHVEMLKFIDQYKQENNGEYPTTDKIAQALAQFSTPIERGRILEVLREALDEFNLIAECRPGWSKPAIYAKLEEIIKEIGGEK